MQRNECDLASDPPQIGGLPPDPSAGAAREGDQMQVPLSPEQAGQILDGLSLDAGRRLSMSDKEAKPSNDKKGRDW